MKNVYCTDCVLVTPVVNYSLQLYRWLFSSHFLNSGHVFFSDSAPNNARSNSCWWSWFFLIHLYVTTASALISISILYALYPIWLTLKAPLFCLSLSHVSGNRGRLSPSRAHKSWVISIQLVYNSGMHMKSHYRSDPEIKYTPLFHTSYTPQASSTNRSEIDFRFCEIMTNKDGRRAWTPRVSWNRREKLIGWAFIGFKIIKFKNWFFAIVFSTLFIILRR